MVLRNPDFFSIRLSSLFHSIVGYPSFFHFALADVFLWCRQNFCSLSSVIRGCFDLKFASSSPSTSSPHIGQRFRIGLEMGELLIGDIENEKLRVGVLPRSADSPVLRSRSTTSNGRSGRWNERCDGISGDAARCSFRALFL